MFTSTRAAADGGTPGQVGIERAIVEGIAPDGGLYVPASLPELPSRVFDPAPLEYAELAYLVLEPFFAGWEPASLKGILDRAYGKLAADGRPCFDLPGVAPTVPLSGVGDNGNTVSDLFLLELFHGRTCAFKDMALSVLGGFLRESLDRLGRKEPVLVLTATSGDTGSAALEGLSGIPGVHAAVLYPEGGTSDIQRLQMTTTGADGRFVAGIRGNFDDAQRAVKSIFIKAAGGKGPLGKVFLSSANSINIGRLLPQIVYYVAAWRDLAARGALGAPGGKRVMHVAVPTGNFGDILAARYAKQMGLPIGTLICASNANKVLADFFATGAYDRRRDLIRTDSPSMDILVSSNLERLLYSASGNNPGRVSALMRDLQDQGWFEVNAEEKRGMDDFLGGWCSDYSSSDAIARTWNTCGVLVDPHTATAIEVALRSIHMLEKDVPILIVGTASPFKFPRACLEALRPESGADAAMDDFSRAKALSEYTGIPIPEPIRALSGARAVHTAILDIDKVEEALGGFAERMKMPDGGVSR